MSKPIKRWFQPQPIITLPSRIKQSAKALAKLLYFRPSYLFLALAVSVLFYEVIFWFLNLGLFQYLISTPHLSWLDKLEIIISSYAGIFTVPLSPLAMALFAVSLLQGVAVAALVFTIKSERAASKSLLKDLGGTGAAGLLAVIGLGCAACGTSLVMPIITFFFATSSVAVANQVGFYSAILALIVSLVTVYLAGYKLSLKEHLVEPKD